MKIINFPNIKKDTDSEKYMYKLASHLNDNNHGALIGKDMGNDVVFEMCFICGFDSELEAEAAALGFLKALHYVNDGGEL